jgi:lysophospholipase L1-like esterase
MGQLTPASRLARALGRVALALCSTAAALLILEASGRLYVHAIHDPGWFREDRDVRLEPYRHAPYYSQEFTDEQSQAFRPLIARGGTHLVLQDFSGTYFNVAGGVRRTVGQPPHADRRILVFGGSTIQAAEVPDAYTIPSFLQRALNEACDAAPAVYNYGVSGMTAAQQLARLEDAGVQRDDVVVFYDGVNEIYLMLYVGTRSQLLESWFDSEDEESTLLQQLPPRMAEVGNSLRYGTAVSYLVFDRAKYREPRTLTDAETLRRNLDAMEDNYRRVLLDAQRYVESRGGHFVHVLQPHLFATPLSTAERRETARTHAPAGIEKAYRLGYPRLRAAINAARGQGVFSLDISTVLAADKVRDDVFFDFCHVNEFGNETAARAMFAGASNRFGCPISATLRRRETAE